MNPLYLILAILAVLGFALHLRINRINALRKELRYVISTFGDRKTIEMLNGEYKNISYRKMLFSRRPVESFLRGTVLGDIYEGYCEDKPKGGSK